ncbi:TnsD family Tn7-like transposition protein [Oryzomonas rubra]|uniref:Uncharacterized protein n=1 Tax=Oryzomonas rubra TaxID=2509454 RepID=A0A5A9XAF1_9BACT|nr:TnsD family Tn7-like transposition protein [Oryzomonas rubra]KAA0889834.1 hypothetical protein ET418_13765 [Oryzomonas rubra]
MPSDARQLPSFPAPAPDETVYSVFVRSVIRSGLLEEVILRVLTGQRFKYALNGSIPGYIASIAYHVPSGHLFQDPGYIVANHTCFPYFTFFAPASVRHELFKKTTEVDHISTIRLSLGLTRYPIPAQPPTHRYCPQCTAQQKQVYGFSFFQRQHQLPGVLVCAKHKSVLYHGCAICGTYPIRRHALIPGCCLCENYAPLPVVPAPENLEPLIWLARESEYLLKSNGTIHGTPRVAIKNAMLDKGMCKGGLVLPEKIADAIDERFGMEALQLLGINTWQGARPASWLRRLFDVKQRDLVGKPAVLMLLVLGSVFRSVKNFEELHEGTGTVSAPVAHAPVKLNERLPGVLQVLVEKDFKLQNVMDHFHASYGTLIRELRRLKATVPLSPKMHKKLGPILEQVRADLRAGKPKNAIMRQYGLCEETIILIELDQPDLNGVHRESARAATRDNHRRAVTKFIQENPGAVRCDIMTRLPGSYDFMARCDREWFLKQFPTRKKAAARQRTPRCDWEGFDRDKTEELERQTVEQCAANDCPVYLSKNALLKKLGIQSRYRMNVDKFPKLSEALSRHVETYDEFVVRRITWAIKQYVGTDMILSMNGLRRIARLPAHLIQEKKMLVAKMTIELDIPVDFNSCFAK